MAEAILVVDDSQDTREIVERNLTSQGYEVLTVDSVGRAIEILEEEKIDLVISDLKMPGKSGMELVRFVKENYTNTEVMLITGYPSIETAIQAVKTGAEEYITKPFTEDELLTAVKASLEKIILRKKGNTRLRETPGGPGGIIGKSKAMKEVYAFMQKAASSSATVLLAGESGTGKELVARGIHYSGNRKGFPFIAVNCGAIPESLLESELFGYVKGAFTGADRTRAGFFQTADRGTMFLDEISEMDLTMQAKLLRVLQEKEIMMLGDRKSIPVDVRIIASTNKDLKLAVQNGSFREDLFYRLHVLPITLPPLREREEDILLLANSFRTKFAKEIGKEPPQLSHRVLHCFLRYEWPGNVRELENTLHRLVVMNDSGVIDVSELPQHIRCDTPESPSASDQTSFKTLAEAEKDYIRKVLQKVGGNKTKAAEILQIDRKTLRSKLGEDS